MRNLFPVILILASIGLFFTLVNPTYLEVRQLRNDVAVYDKALTNARDLENVRDELKKNYDLITKEEKDRLDHFLPNTVDNIQLILQIQKIATAHNMNLKNIKFDAPSLIKQDSNSGSKASSASSSKNNALPYGIFNLEFSTDARYEDFKAFLKDLEYNIRLVNVKEISFTVPSGDKKTVFDPNSDISNDPNVYTYSLKVETYWLK